jgi:phosphate-selective porin
MAAANGDNWTVSVGLFGDTVTSQNNDDEGMEAVGRVTYAPFFQSDRVLHLGASGGWVHPQQTANGLETVRFRSKPETNDRKRHPLKPCRHFWPQQRSPTPATFLETSTPIP